jgi:hypothetical protein
MRVRRASAVAPRKRPPQAAAMVETGFRPERASRFVAANSVADVGFAGSEIAVAPDIVAAPDTARDIEPVAAAPETDRLAR